MTEEKQEFWRWTEKVWQADGIDWKDAGAHHGGHRRGLGELAGGGADRRQAVRVLLHPHRLEQPGQCQEGRWPARSRAPA